MAAGIWYYNGTIDGIDRPWIFISDDMFGGVMSPGAIIGTPAVPKVLWSYTTLTGGQIATGLGVLYQAPGPTIWESARAQHVYLRPQRVNWIPNPSFEDVGMFGWRANGTLARRTRGVDLQARFHGEVNGTEAQSIAVPKATVFRYSAYVRVMGKTNGFHIGAPAPIPMPGRGRASNALMAHALAPVPDLPDLQRPIYADWIRLDEMIFTPDEITAVVPCIRADAAFDFDLVLLEDAT